MHDFLSQSHIEEEFKWVFNECRYELFGSTAGKLTIYTISAENETLPERDEILDHCSKL